MGVLRVVMGSKEESAQTVVLECRLQRRGGKFVHSPNIEACLEFVGFIKREIFGQ